MEMQQIRYFLALSEELNFTRAAARCRVSQPSLTRAIMRLERELGGALIHRARSRTRLTGLGETVRPHLSAVLQNAETAKRQAEAFMRAAADGEPPLGTQAPLSCRPASAGAHQAMGLA